MRLEIFGSLFAMILSLFVTVDDVSLYNPSRQECLWHSCPPSPRPAGLTIRGGNGVVSPLKVRGDRGVIRIPTINAKSAWIGCLCNESPLFSQHASTQLPLASITKVMTSYLALRELGSDYLVAISNDAIATEGIAGDLQSGEELTVRDLITMAMTYSSNDAAMALAEALGRAQGSRTFEDAIARTVFLMNEEASVLGMRHTFFQNPTGLDVSRADSEGFPLGPSNFSTAEDWAILLNATRTKPFLWDLSRDPAPRVVSKNGIAHELLNLNPFRSFPHYVGGKTGTTDFAGENLVMLFEKPLGKLHALILFGAPPGQREAEAQKLLDWIASF